MNPVDYEQLFVRPARPVPTPVPAGMDIEWDFAGANPGPDMLPLDDLAEAAREAILSEGAVLSLYPPVRGALALRELIVDKVRRERGIGWASADQVLVTNGSLHGMSLALELLVSPGDVIVSDRFFYMGAVRKFAEAGARVVTVDSDEDGMRTEALRSAVSECVGRGQRVKFIYTVPGPQNPLGTIMSDERRRGLLAVAEEFDTLIVEDDCYSDQLLDVDSAPVAISALPGGQDRVLYLGTFSKLIGPGVRLGWALGARPLIERMSMYKQDGGKDYLTSIVVANFWRHHGATRAAQVNSMLRTKRSVLVGAIRERLGQEARFEVPKAGMFLWVEFPASCDFEKMEAEAIKRGVKYLSGSHFSPTGEGKNIVRFNYSFPSTDRISDGIAMFAEVAESEGVLPAAT